MSKLELPSRKVPFPGDIPWLFLPGGGRRRLCHPTRAYSLKRFWRGLNVYSLKPGDSLDDAVAWDVGPSLRDERSRKIGTWHPPIDFRAGLVVVATVVHNIKPDVQDIDFFAVRAIGDLGVELYGPYADPEGAEAMLGCPWAKAERELNHMLDDLQRAAEVFTSGDEEG